MTTTKKQQQRDEHPLAMALSEQEPVHPLWMIAMDLEGAEKRFEEAKAKFVESFAGDDAHPGNPAYTLEWQGASVLEAQAKYVLALDLLPEDRRLDESAITEFDQNVDRFVKDQERHLGMLRGASMSTNDLANVCERVSDAVKAKLYSDVLQARRYAALKQAAQDSAAE